MYNSFLAPKTEIFRKLRWTSSLQVPTGVKILVFYARKIVNHLGDKLSCVTTSSLLLQTLNWIHMITKFGVVVSILQTLIRR